MALTTFDECVLFTLKHEGGCSNNPNDPGGETKYGISKRYHPDLDIANLTQAQATEIYRHEYWEPNHCFSLAPPIALMVFDTAVVPGDAVRILQRACAVEPDGKFGPVTLRAVQSQPIKLLIEALHMGREAAFRKSPKFDDFGKGWMARNDDCRDEALSWVEPRRIRV